jgi:filamentous hemagglutinin family protein
VFGCGGLLPGFVTVLASVDARANPQGMTVVSGKASAQQTGNTLNITTSQNAFLQWSSFNIGKGEKTRFQQPSSTSVVWNQIGSQSASSIFGSLQANGIVVLANKNGFYFGPDSFVKAAGLVVTTAPIKPPDNAGAGWAFTGSPHVQTDYQLRDFGNDRGRFVVSNLQAH